MDTSPHPRILANDHEAYIQYALVQARKSPPAPTNFCVGAVLLDADKNEILATGYTLELPGNTHAEQCCFMKIAQSNGTSQGYDSVEDEVGISLPANTVLYTTVEPCNKRLSGNKTCVERILSLKGTPIRTVYIGVKEPEKFVGQNQGRAKLEAAGIQVVHIPGLEDQILAVATSGHAKPQQ